MFGERYFATRERLSAVVSGVRRLARETGTDAGPLEDTSPEGFLSGLADPVVFAVTGEVNAGKSSFLNGLMGQEVCQTNVLPETKMLHWFRHGPDERDDECGEWSVDCTRDFDFLQSFGIIDTPGTNTADRSHLAVLESILPKVDLLFVIFPVTNPWGAATWDFLARIADEFRQKLVLVLQQKDRCSEADLNVMVGHMRDLAVHKIGEAPPVFPVSATMALEAKGGERFDHRLWKDSGFAKLEEHVSGLIDRSSARLDVLRGIRDATSATLRDIEDRMEDRRRTLDSDQGFLREIELEVDQERNLHAGRFGEKFSGLGEVFNEQAADAARLLRSRTSMTRSIVSLFQKDQTPTEIEKGLIEAVEKAIAERADRDSDELVETCHAHWLTVVPRVESRLGMAAPDFERDSGDFDGSKERFARRLARSARSAVVHQKLRVMLDTQMEARRILLRRSVVICLGAFSVGGLLGSLHHNLAGLLAVAVGIVFLAISLFKARQTSNELVEWFEERASASREPFAEALSADYEEGVRSFFVEYAALFEGIRRHVATLKMKLKPQLEEWNNLFLELRAIEQEL